MEQLRRILENQKEVLYLTYFISIEKDESISAEFSTLGISKRYKFRTENDCLNRVIDILFELKKLEKWYLSKEKK